jgi:hypothetical protein
LRPATCRPLGALVFCFLDVGSFTPPPPTPLLFFLLLFLSVFFLPLSLSPSLYLSFFFFLFLSISPSLSISFLLSFTAPDKKLIAPAQIVRDVQKRYNEFIASSTLHKTIQAEVQPV